MRLSTDQQCRIQHLVRAHLGCDAQVAVFGSRTDDAKRGGDVDLFIEAPRRVSLLQRAALKLALEQTLLLPVDLLINAPGKPLSPFQAVAKARAQPLGKHVA